MEIINEHSAEWRNFVKNDNRIYKAMYRATTAFANLQPLPEPAIVLGRRYYRHEILCRDKLARYSCNNTECALWDGEILTMAWSAFSHYRLNQVLEMIYWKCEMYADKRAGEDRLPFWVSPERWNYNRLEIDAKAFCIVPRGSWPRGISYRGPVAYNLMRHEFPPDNPHTIRLMDWLVRKFIATRRDGGKYFACIQGLGLPVPVELKGAFDDRLWMLEPDNATPCLAGTPDQYPLPGQTEVTP